MSEGGRGACCKVGTFCGLQSLQKGFRVDSFCGCCSLSTGLFAIAVVWIICGFLHVVFAIVDLYHEVTDDDTNIPLVVLFTLLLFTSIIITLLTGFLVCGIYLHKLHYVKVWFWAALLYGLLRAFAFIVYCVILAVLGGELMLFIRIICLGLELGWITFSLIVAWSYITYAEEGRPTGSMDVEGSLLML